MEEIKTGLLDLMTQPSDEFIVEKFSGTYTYRIKEDQGFVGVHSEEMCKVFVIRIIDKTPRTSEFVIQEGRGYFQVNPPKGNSVEFLTAAEVIDFIKEHRTN